MLCLKREEDDGAPTDDVFGNAYSCTTDLRQGFSWECPVTPAVNLKMTWSLFTAGTLISACIIQTMSSFALMPVLVVHPQLCRIAAADTTTNS
ncbi:hypothetical protein AKJ16_DCAP18422 [Drosera capensis]